MKGERTVKGQPFRFGGIEKNFDMDSDEWVKIVPAMKRCYACGGAMRNMRIGSITKKSYPYIATFKITKGKNKGYNRFHVLCRACAYAYGLGVIEMDGNTYERYDQFNEENYKKKGRTSI